MFGLVAAAEVWLKLLMVEAPLFIEIPFRVEKAGLGVVGVVANGVTGFEDEEDNALDKLSTWGIYYTYCVGLLEAGWLMLVTPLVMLFI